jgi:hypothetical protein
MSFTRTNIMLYAYDDGTVGAIYTAIMLNSLIGITLFLRIRNIQPQTA